MSMYQTLASSSIQRIQDSGLHTADPASARRRCRRHPLKPPQSLELCLHAIHCNLGFMQSTDYGNVVLGLSSRLHFIALPRLSHTQSPLCTSPFLRVQHLPIVPEFQRIQSEP
jgi:hypothetical protein